MLPSIPDVLGWVLGFFVLWLIYTAISRGIEFITPAARSAETVINAPPLVAKEDAKGTAEIGQRFRRAATGALTTATTSIDRLSDKFKEQLKAVVPQQPSPAREPAPPDPKNRIQRF